MKGKITKRDVLFFVLGFMALFLIEVVVDWDDNVKAFKEGYKMGASSAAENPEVEENR